MSPNVRAIKEDHTQSRILILHLFKESLPDAGFCPTDEELGCSPPGPSSAGMARHFVPF